MTEQRLLELAHAVVAQEGRPRPRIGSPYCLVCHEDAHRETPVCDGCASRVIAELSRALLAADIFARDANGVVVGLGHTLSEALGLLDSFGAASPERYQLFAERVAWLKDRARRATAAEISRSDFTTDEGSRG